MIVWQRRISHFCGKQGVFYVVLYALNCCFACTLSNGERFLNVYKQSVSFSFWSIFAWQYFYDKCVQHCNKAKAKCKNNRVQNCQQFSTTLLTVRIRKLYVKLGKRPCLIVRWHARRYESVDGRLNNWQIRIHYIYVGTSAGGDSLSGSSWWCSRQLRRDGRVLGCVEPLFMFGWWRHHQRCPRATTAGLHYTAPYAPHSQHRNIELCLVLNLFFILFCMKEGKHCITCVAAETWQKLWVE